MPPEPAKPTTEPAVPASPATVPARITDLEIKDAQIIFEMCIRDSGIGARE